MKISGNHVVITGGASGIGEAITQKCVENGNDVIVVGRDSIKLDSIKKKISQHSD